MSIPEEAIVKIRKLAGRIDGKVNIMHLCGTHEDTVTRYNLRSLLPENVELISGPGCPVCIIPDVDLQKVFHLLQNKKIILTTFGDMARVPYRGKSLFYFRAKGHDVRIVYSIFDALEISRESSIPVVHFGIGFETTMPSTAIAIMDGVENFYVYSAHRFFLPAMKHLLELGEIRIDGFINPGHVSTIVGSKAYEELRKFSIPQVIAGFEPYDVIFAIYIILKALTDENPEIFNEYSRVVTEDGNVRAQEAMNEAFNREDWEWRGLGIVPYSGAEISDRYSEFDATKYFEDIFADFVPEEDPVKKLCRCGDVLRGLITPEDCDVFNKACNPRNPIGPCMVSFEGTCNIWSKYGWR